MTIPVIDPYIELSDLVADLKARVEALERRLAERDTPSAPVQAPPDWSSKDVKQGQVDLAALWDNASNQEKRWSEEDFTGAA